MKPTGRNRTAGCSHWIESTGDVVAKKIRRIVTGHDKDGKAVVLKDGHAENVWVLPSAGFTATALWVTEGTPADLSGNADGADIETAVGPPESGSIFRTVEFPPTSDGGASVDAAQLAEDMGIPRDVAGLRHPFMHRTQSIDYAICLSGKITMLLDEEDVEIEAGDVVVQRGTDHAWVNTGTEPCLMVFVLIGAKTPPEIS